MGFGKGELCAETFLPLSGDEPAPMKLRQYMIGAIDTSLRFRLLKGALVRAHTCGAISVGGTVTSLVPYAHRQSC